MDLSSLLIISFCMLVIGIIGILARRNPLIMFLSIELMLNSANLLFVAFSRQWGNQIGL
ncbi:MAG: NADH-quinone oxidoreductase subunit K, partial [Verrucomicrobia bacterium]|nr:NADH-quinone oxidoreductase subunit K [Verrucomicrobiota bacterium]